MKRTIAVARCAVPAIVAAAILAGCSGSGDLPTATPLPSERLTGLGATAALPTPVGGVFPGTGDFYPLQIDNHWFYRQQTVTQLIPSEGEAPLPHLDERWFDHVMLCPEPRDGRWYIVEQIVESGPVVTVPMWVRYRQDRTGLYEADMSLGSVPFCYGEIPIGPPPGGGATPVDPATLVSRLVPTATASRQAAMVRAVEDLEARRVMVTRLGKIAGASSSTGGSGSPGDELTRLSYPLRVGARWIIRGAPDVTFAAIVEGADVLNLAVGRQRGFRIRIESTYLRPGDFVRTWYGKSGYLQRVSHFETDAVDIEGRIVGRVTLDDRETLVFMDLGPPAIAFTPHGPLGSADTSGGPPR